MFEKIFSSKTQKNIDPRLRYKICVSGSSKDNTSLKGDIEKAIALGREIAKKNLVLLTGATTGLPQWSAEGAKKAGGIVIGFSPAASEISHIKTYHLPMEYHDLIVYTGAEYSGRNLVLINSSDAVITIGGRMGTLNEFTVAYEMKKIIGVLEETGGAADKIKELILGLDPHSNAIDKRIVFSDDPAKLIDMVMDLIQKEKRKYDSKD